MPVTAKLSREFYDRFGDKVVDELVGLLNSMDTTFRLELRDLNEQNFRRFEARLDQRTAELGAALRTEMASLAATLRAEMGDLKSELREEIAEVRGELRQEIGGVRQEMAALKAELIKWMFLFWLGTVATMVGIGRVFLAG